MRIGIDCRLAGKRHAGIGRYVENLIKNLLDLSNAGTENITWVFFFYDQNQAQEILGEMISNPKVEIVITKILHYSILEQIKLPFIYYSQKLDLLHVPHFNAPIFYNKKLVSTIHDLLWHEQKGVEVTTLKSWQYWIKYIGYKITTLFTIKKSAYIFTPSETIKKTIGNYYSFAKNKTLVTYEGTASLFKKNNSKISSSNKIVYTGSLYPHKNLEVVLKSLQILPHLQLSIVGARNVFQDKTKEQAKNLGVSKQVFFLGYLSDQELVALYHNSLALIQPSLSEGFGLTGIEAMACGLPVIASNIPIFEEIYDDGALFFDPKSPDDLANKIKLLSDDKIRGDLIFKAKQISQKYDWQNMSNQTREIYQRVLSS